MKLEVLPAQKGDCLLLQSETAAGPGLIIIDGGPAGVSADTLIPRLEALREERGLHDQEALVIDLVIVSHVDDDHINGVIDLLHQMLERDQAGDAPLFKVRGLWHNSFDRVLGHDPTAGLLRTTQFGPASMAPILEEAEPGPETDHAKILASIPQGAALRDLADALRIPLNRQFGGALIQTVAGTVVVQEVAEVEFTVVGPRRDELNELQKAFETSLASQPAPDRTARSLMAALEDTSVANLSSIVLLARAGDRTILLTGDARSDKVMEGLKDCGLIADGQAIEVGVLKMPHHGSIRNLDERGEFLGRVTSKNYVFSGNGEHGNPDRETVELLFRTRPNDDMTLYFTYPLADIDRVRRQVHERERTKRIKKGKPGGPEWSDATHSLTALLSPPPAAVRVVQVGNLII